MIRSRNQTGGSIHVVCDATHRNDPIKTPFRFRMNGPARGRVGPRAADGLILVLTFLSRLPFLSEGPGADADVWRMLDAGTRWVDGCGYAASRLPGYPLMEGFLGITARAGWWLPHLILAAFSSVTALLVYRLLRLQRVSGAWWLALAFALHPIFWSASVELMDYAISLALLVGSFVLAVKGRSPAAGILLGLSVGFRFNTALFLPALLLAAPGSRIRLAVVAAVVSIACFLPSLRANGAAAFLSMFAHDYGFPLSKFIPRGAYLIVVQVVTLPVLLAVTAWAFRPARSAARTSRIAVAGRVAAGISLAAYFAHPMELEYLLPLLVWLPVSFPSFWTRRRAAILLGLVLLGHAWVAAPHPRWPLRLWPGHFRAKLALAHDMEAHAQRLYEAGRESRCVTVSGPVFAILEYRSRELGLERTRLPLTRALRDSVSGSYHVYLLRGALVDSLKREGYTFVSSEHAAQLSQRGTGINLYGLGEMIRIDSPSTP